MRRLEGRPRIVRVSPEAPEAGSIAEAAQALRDGLLVAFPTETVYGLGANALDAEAVARIFDAKGRPPDNPLIVHIAAPAQLAAVARDVPPTARAFIERFWPGPLTLVFPRGEQIPEIVTAHGPTVAVRCPAHPIARALLLAAGVPVAAPSANRSGRPSPTRAEHVADDLGAEVAMILDGGPTQVGVESTVLDLTRDPPVVLRLGGVDLEALQAVLPAIRVHPHALGEQPAPDEAVASPGLRHRHYAPRTPLFLHAGRDALRMIGKAVVAATASEKRLGLILSDESAKALRSETEGHVVRTLGARDDAAAWAAGIFDALRMLDAAEVDRILVEGIPAEGLGAAVMDRLRRAAEPPDADY